MSHAGHGAKALRFALEPEPGAEPIVGRLYAEKRPRHRFHGWLEFAAAIESACSEGSAEPSDPRNGWHWQGPAADKP